MIIQKQMLIQLIRFAIADAVKAEIDAMLERLAALSADNFETNRGRLPDQIITLNGSGEPGARPA
jgi:hypothetical protein